MMYDSFHRHNSGFIEINIRTLPTIGKDVNGMLTC